MSISTGEEMLLNFDGWLAKQDEATKGGLTQQLNTVPDDQRPIEKQRLGAMVRIGEEHPELDAATINDQWHLIRGGYAERRGGDWNAVKDDEPAFLGKMVSDATQQRDERHLLQGLDDTKAPEAQAAWDSSLLNRASEAAYAGKSYADALGDWQDTAKGKPGYAQERTAKYEDLARTAHARMTGMVAKVRPLAEQAFEQIAQARGVKEGEGDSAPFALLRGLAPQEKELAFRVMTDKAGNSGADKLSTEAFLEGVGRGFENLVIGGGAAAFRSRLLQSRFTEGDLVTRGNALDEVASDYTADSVMRSSVGSGGAGFARAQEKAKGRKLTADEAKTWNAQLDVAREDLDTAEQLRKFGQQVIDPTNKAGGAAFQKVMLPAADSLAIMASLAIPGTWAPALELGARSYQGEEYTRLREQGMDAQQADRLALISGSAQAALDKLEFGILSKGFPGTARALKQFSMTGSAGARFAGNFTGTFLAETLVEATQDHIIPALVQDIFAADPAFDVHWGDVWTDTAKALPDLAMGMVLLSAAGGAAQTREQTMATRELGASKAAMRLRGYTLEQIEQISATPADGRAALLAELLPAKAPEGEAQKDLVADVVRLAREEQAAFEVRKAAETAAAMEAADYAIRVVRNPQGWQVVRESGKTVTVDTAEAARSIREDLLQASTQEEADALVAIIDDFHEQTPEGTERQTTLTGETATSDGKTITYTRPGVGVVREVTDSSTLEALRKEAQAQANATGDGVIDVVVHGSNTLEFKERIAEDATRIVQRLEINQSDSPAFTVVHERVEAVWRTGRATGAITWDETRRAVASVASAFDPAQARTPEERAFREQVQRVARGEGSEVEMQETMSELTVGEVIGRRRDNTLMPAGTITKALNAMIARGVSAEDLKAIGKFRAVLRGVRQYFRALFGTVAALKKAKREGGGVELENLVNRLLSLDAQAAHDKARAERLEEILKKSGLTYTPPTPEEEEAGIAFSLAPSNPKRDARLLRPVQIPAGVLEGRSADWRLAVRKFIAEALQGRALLNKDTGHEIQFNSKSRGESVSKLKREPQFRASMQIIPIVEDAIFLGDAAPEGDRERDTERFRYFAMPVDIDGHSAVAWFNTRKPLETPNPSEGGIFYEFGLYDKAAQTSPGLDAGNQPDTPTFGPEETVGEFLSKIKDVLPAAIKVENGPSFRLSGGKRLELIQRQTDATLAKDPAKRRALARMASEKLQRLQFNMETERWTPSGDKTRPIGEKRTVAELDKEQAVRQAVRADELLADAMGKLSPSTITAYNQGAEQIEGRPLIATMLGNHGKLVSKTEAARRGDYGEYDGVPWLPPKLYSTSGGLMPDEMAQALYEEGLLREPSPDALWQALGAEVESVRRVNEAFKSASEEVKELERKTRNQAKEEAFEWRREQDEMQAQDWSFKAALVRDLRTLEALASVLPPEIRGKLGGAVKLAQLTTNEARLAELGRRVEKMGELVEKHLQKETTEAMDALLEKAAPKREPGKASRGKLGAEAHRFFDAVEAAMMLTDEELDAKRAGLDAALIAPGVTTEQAADIFEQQQILDTFGAWKEKSAADMDAALSVAEGVYTTGRNARRIIEEARLAEVGAMAEQMVAALSAGNPYAGSQGQKAPEGAALRFASKLALDLKSFGEVLDTLLGADHPLAERWTRAAREGEAQRNTERTALRKRWKGALEAATGGKGVKARRVMWDMAHEQTVSAQNAGALKGSTETVPLTLIDRWKAGTASPDALGVTQDQADALIAERDAMEPDDRREGLPLARATREAAAVVPMTQAEGIFLTMLGAQEQYTEALDRAGWTADTLAEIEAQLNAPAKALREFMRGEYRDGYGPLAAVFEQMYGVALPQVKNYAPAAFYHTGAERETGPEDSGAGGGMRAGFLANRKRHTAAPRLENAFATFFGHSEQTSHWKAMAPFIREFSGVMGRPQVKAAIEAAHGKEMLKALSDWTRNLEGNGLQKQAGQLDKAVGWLVSAQAHIALAWRLGTLMKQSSALLGSAYRIPFGEYARGFGKLFTGQLEVGKIYASPVIQRRLESGFAPEVRAALGEIWTAKPSQRAAFMERGMELIGLTDAMFTTGSAAIAYDYHLREALKAGLTGAAAETAAMEQVENIVSRTAQPADASTRSLFEARQGAFGRLLFMFASEARQKSSLMLTAWQNTLTGKATKADVRVLVLAHLVIAPMMQAITAGWRDLRDDDDDEIFDAEHWSPMDFLKAIVAGPLSGIPIIGSALSGFNDEGVLGRNKRAIQSAGQLLDGPAEKEDEPVEWYVKRIARVMQGLDAFTGVAGGIIEQAFSVADNLLPDTTSEAAKKDRARVRKERRDAKGD